MRSLSLSLSLFPAATVRRIGELVLSSLPAATGREALERTFPQGLKESMALQPSHPTSF